MVKTIDNWFKEADFLQIKYEDLYVNSITDKNCPLYVCKYYQNIYLTNRNIKKLLNHIKLYGSYYNPKFCKECENYDNTHCSILHDMNNRYGKWIKRNSNQGLCTMRQVPHVVARSTV